MEKKKESNTVEDKEKLLLPEQPQSEEVKPEKKPPTEKERMAGHRKRVKETFIQGGGTKGMSEHRALELLLFYAIPQGDVVGLARDLLFTYGTFQNVLSADYDSLLKNKGVGPNTATLLKLVPAMLAYFDWSQEKAYVFVHTTEEAYHIFKPYFTGLTNELVFILCLDADFKFLGVRKVSEGGFLGAGVNLRRVVTEAINLGATFIYMAHNHVTGPLAPSNADWNVTETLMSLLHPLDIYILDHVIVGDENHASLRYFTTNRKLHLPWPKSGMVKKPMIHV